MLLCWVCSPQLESLTYTADCTAALHAVVMVLPSLTQLSALSLTARGFAIPPETARLIGRLPLLSLRLDSAVYESQVRPEFTFTHNRSFSPASRATCSLRDGATFSSCAPGWLRDLPASNLNEHLLQG